MKTYEVEEIKELIQKAEFEKAKSQGVKDSIKAGWKKEYGFETIDEAKEKLQELKAELNKNKTKKDKLIDELNKSQDWDLIEREFDED